MQDVYTMQSYVISVTIPLQGLVLELLVVNMMLSACHAYNFRTKAQYDILRP